MEPCPTLQQLCPRSEKSSNVVEVDMGSFASSVKQKEQVNEKDPGSQASFHAISILRRMLSCASDVVTVKSPARAHQKPVCEVTPS